MNQPASVTSPPAPAPAPPADRPDAAPAPPPAPGPGRLASPRLSARELWLVIAGASLLAVITSWPLVLHLSNRVVPDLGDPLRTAWQIAWEGHALLHHPLHIFQTNAFWPHPDSLAFSDSLLGYAPVGVFGQSIAGAMVVYNLLFIFAWALPVVGAYLLARELGLRPAGAVIAGVAFAYAPYRAAVAGHLHVISSGGAPLALFLLLRGYRRSSPGLVAAGWLVAAWQISLGFTLGLQLSYLLAALALVAVVLWWRRGRPSVPQPVLIATLAGGLAFCGVAALESRPYLRVASEYPTARRHIAEVQRFSAGPRAFLSAPDSNRVWGSATAPMRNRLRSQNESDFFPGAVIALLALAGLAAGVHPGRLRALLAAAAAVCGVLALGLGLTGAGYPYRILYDYFPGWDGVRVPGRIFMLASLALALLAGAGAQAVLDRAGGGPWTRRLSARAGRGVALALAGILGAAIVFEGAARQPHPPVPQPPRGLAVAVKAAGGGPLLELPTEQDTDRVFQLWTVGGFPRIVNGVSTFEIPALTDLRGGMQNFPDAPGVAKLQRLHIYTVALFTNLVGRWPLPPEHFAIPEPPNPVQAATKSIAGLPVDRYRVGSVVIFKIHPLARGPRRR